MKSRDNGLTIDLTPNRRFNHIDSCHFDYQTLLSLVQLCQKIGGRLKNVPSRALPTLEDSKKLSREQFIGLEKVTESIIVSSSQGLKNKIVPSTSAIIVDIYSGRALEDFNNFELQGKIKVIRIISIDHFSNVIGMSHLYGTVFNSFRPSLVELRVERNAMDHLASGLQISTNFPNLRILELSMWGENENGFHNLLKGLPQLEDLSFISCINCTDGALLGPDFQNPLIRQLPSK